MGQIIMDTKADLINKAYSLLRINGLTVNASANEVALALDRLETMMSELDLTNLNYAFENVPDPSTPHNLDRKYWHAIAANLAVRLISDYNKQVPQQLTMQAAGGLNFILGRNLAVSPVPYPTRQPIGEANRLRFGYVHNYFPPVAETATPENINYLYINDVNDYAESYAHYLKEAEDVLSYTITADEGLTLLSDSNDTENVYYSIQATGSQNTSYLDRLFKVVIVVTTTLGRVTTRVILFKLQTV